MGVKSCRGETSNSANTCNNDDGDNRGGETSNMGVKSNRVVTSHRAETSNDDRDGGNVRQNVLMIVNFIVASRKSMNFVQLGISFDDVR